MLRIFFASSLLILTGCSISPESGSSPRSPANRDALESSTQVPPPLSLDSATTVPAAARLYVCPMHASVVSDHPGKCPICGMALEPKGGAK